MPYETIAICDKCKKRSTTSTNRSTLANQLKSIGWVKGGRPNSIYCPDCFQSAIQDRLKRQRKIDKAKLKK